MMRSLVIAVSVLWIVVAAACGDDDSGPKPTTDATVDVISVSDLARDTSSDGGPTWDGPTAGDGQTPADATEDAGPGQDSAPLVDAPSEPALVVITEIMANPEAVGDTEGEWFELYNAGSNQVNLNGWRIEDLGTNSHTISGDVLIDPGQYIVLGRSAASDPADPNYNGGVTLAYEYPGFQMANSDDEIHLYDAFNTLIDKVEYNTGSGWTVPAGSSISLDPVTADNNDPDNWCVETAPWPTSAGDNGTPGEAAGCTTSVDAGPPPDTVVPADVGPALDTVIPADVGPTLDTVIPVDSGPSPDTAITDTTVPDASVPDSAVPDSVAPDTAVPDAAVPDAAVPDAAVPDAPVEPAQIVITEMMIDPAEVDDTEGEWFEIYNAGSGQVNLNGWRIADLGSNSHTISDDVLIDPGQYIVLGRSGVTDPADPDNYNGGVTLAYEYSGFTLANSEDEIILYDGSDAVIDSVEYNNQADWTVPSGATISLIAVDADNSDPDNWCAETAAWATSAGDYGTPGEATGCTLSVDAGPIPDAAPPIDGGVEPAQIVITEMMINPAAVDDTEGEWFEVYNAGDSQVNLDGWRIADLGSNSHTISGDVLIDPGQHIVLGRSSVTDPGDPDNYNGGVTLDYEYSGFTLANSEDEIILHDGSNAVIDSVAYDTLSGWTVPSGSSLSLTELDADNSDPGNWCVETAAWTSSAGDYGTPGEAAGCTAAAQIVITEMMIHPFAVDDTEGEWFELYNAGDSQVNLDGWRIADLGSDSHTISGELLIDPGQYIVLGRSGVTDSNDEDYNGGVDLDYEYSGFALANSDDEIVLYDGSDTLIDSVVYDSQSAWTIPEGASLSLTAVDADNTVPDSWCAETAAWATSAGDYGTPGEAAGCTAAAQIVITEIMVHPLAVDDPEGEWFELYNAGESQVNLNGWRIADQGSDSHTISGDLLIAPGQYIVLGRSSVTDSGDEDYNGGVDVDYEYSGFPLANSADEIVLYDTLDTLIDSVAYDTGAGWTVTEGASLSLGSVDADNSDSASWCTETAAWSTSAGDFGTPGEAAGCTPQ